MSIIFEALWRAILVVVNILAGLVRYGITSYAMRPIGKRGPKPQLQADFAHDLLDIDPCGLGSAGLPVYSQIAEETLARMGVGPHSQSACRRALEQISMEHGCEPSPLGLRISGRVLKERMGGYLYR
jgi:hypothetical protein